MSLLNQVIHPLFLKICPLLRNFPLTEYKSQEIPKRGPVIFVANHSNMHDVPAMIEIIHRQAYLLADDGPRGTVAGFAFSVNGVIWINRDEKASAHAAVDSMRDHLRRGDRLLIFPEGTWNTSECLPMLPFSWSTTELAREFQCPIIPVTLEYPNFQSCYYSIGEPFFVQDYEDKAEAAARLRDIMATMRWDFWASNGCYSRQEISSSDYEVYSIDRFKEYQPDNWEEDFKRERGKVFHPYTTPEQAFEYLQAMQLNSK